MSPRQMRLISWVALTMFTATLAAQLVVVHVGADPDLARGGVEVWQRTTDRIAAAQPSEAGHCAVCHWLQALSGAAPDDATSRLAWERPGLARALPQPHRPARSVRSPGPARAPPTA